MQFSTNCSSIARQWVILFCLFHHFSMGQISTADSLLSLIENEKNDTLRIKYTNSLIDEYLKDELDKAISLSEKNSELAMKAGYLQGAFEALKKQGIAHYYKGDHVNALTSWEEALETARSDNDKNGESNILNNIGAIYFNESDYDKAFEHYLKSLKLAEEINDTLRILTALTNIGAVYGENPSMHHKAITYDQKALEMAKAIGDQKAIGTLSINIGEIYHEQKDYGRAIKYFNEGTSIIPDNDGKSFAFSSLAAAYNEAGEYEFALQHIEQAIELAESVNSIPNLAKAYDTKANIYINLKNYPEALQYLRSSAALSRELHALKQLESVYENMVFVFSEQQQYDSAFKYQNEYKWVSDSIYNSETDKLLSNQLFGFELDKRESEIDFLIKDQELQKETIRRQKTISSAVGGGLALVVVFLIVVGFQSKRIQREKVKSDKLLLNILPEKVAAELKAKGEAEAQLIDEVTVLFTDFKGFTAHSEKVTPKELVHDLHECFSAFDHICEKNNIEKIKTIGDAYMAAGGLPTPNSTHAGDVIKAALEMAEVVSKGKAKKIAYDLPYFEIRIGIHTGPVVAGIVGVKKFSYDIWGDTVNTASRMESSGEVGKVNISQSTYELLKSDEQFEFESRGKITAKGKGEIEMYFVQPSAMQ